MTAPVFGTLEHLVAQLVAMGFTREDAEAQMRAQHPELVPPPPASDIKRENVLEKNEQAECVKIYRAHSCIVYSTSQYRPARVSTGIPDLLLFSPRVHAFWFHEVKRSIGATQSPSQRDFNRLCAECGIRYVIGDRDVAWSTVRELGVATAPG